VRGRRRALSDFERAILDAGVYRQITDDGDDLRGIVIPDEHASGAYGGRSHKVEGGVLFVTDGPTRAEMLVRTLESLADGADTPGLRRRVAVLRRLITPEEWDQGELVLEAVEAMNDPTLEPQ
jgi:hypothetical protein